MTITERIWIFIMSLTFILGLGVVVALVAITAVALILYTGR